MTGAHFGARKFTCSLFAYIWRPKLYAYICKFISACDACKKPKDSTFLHAGLLHSLLIPKSRFTYYSMVITEFPLLQGYNAIFVYMDCLTKYTNLIQCFMGEHLLTSEQVALLFFQNLVQYFGIPTSVIQDRDKIHQ